MALLGHFQRGANHSVLPKFNPFLPEFFHVRGGPSSPILSCQAATGQKWKIICKTPHFPRFSVILAPTDSKKCWQERIEFWQDRMVGPPLKMTQLRLCCIPWLLLLRKIVIFFIKRNSGYPNVHSIQII